MNDIKMFSQDELTQWLTAHNIAPYRAIQILKWVYLRQADDFEVMTDLSKDIRMLLAAHFCIARLKAVKIDQSTDGTKKYLFRLKDGHTIESVIIPEKKHYTLCISSQVGCAQGCRFCMTAVNGLVRNLDYTEIINQVRDLCQDLSNHLRINIVFMGMGEPLANYDNLIRAILILTDHECGLKIAIRKITVSTAGLVPKILRLGQDTGVNLAVSLNAADNLTRTRLMPLNRKYPLEDILTVCRKYPLGPHRKITFEYILIQDLNDTPNHARQLIRLLEPKRAKINLIPFNPHSASDFARPTQSVINQFQEILMAGNFTTMIRNSRGADINAACGQLRSNND